MVLKTLLKQSLFLGAISALCLSPTAKAAEQVTLKYGEEERTFAVDHIINFSRTGEATDPDLRAFFDRSPEAGRILRAIENADIYISPAFVSQIEQQAQSPTADFILIQLNKFIAVPSSSDDIGPLETALLESLRDDNRVTLVELISRYPRPEVSLNLTGLEPIYNNVKGFVERVLPALEVAKEFLSNVICDCQTAQATSPQSPRAGLAVPVATEPVNCINVSPTLGQESPLPTATSSTATLAPSAPDQ